MAKIALKRAKTSKILRVFIRKISDGRPLSGLVFNSAGLTAYYILEGAASPVAITLVTATVGTWTSSGFKEIDATNLPGWYELHLPNAALATGESVGGMLKGATDMLECPFELQFDAVDAQDTVRYGLTALPNAAAGANGGLPLGNASGQTTVATVGTGAIVAGSFGAGAVDAAALAADAGTEIATAVWASGTRTLTSLSALAAQIASAVWDAVATSYNVALSMGNKLNAAGSSGDPWTTALPGAYGAGTAGKIMGAVDTEVAAIKAKTDLLGTGSVTASAPVATSGDVTLIRGDDYSGLDGRALEWTNAAGTWPDLTGATITLTTDQGWTHSGSVIVPTGPGQKIRVELTAAETTIAPGTSGFDMQAGLVSGRKATLLFGRLTVRADVTTAV